MERYHPINIAGIDCKLPIVNISKELAIAGFVIFGDVRLPYAAALELSKKVPECDVIVTAEAKSITFVYELAKVLKHEKYIIFRKSVKGYMVDPFIETVNSITTSTPQILCAEKSDIEYMRGKRILLADDVISTGESMAAISKLVEKSGGEIVGKVCILTEGDIEKHKDVISLGHIPLFKAE